MAEYVPDQLESDQLAQINPDGSVKAPGLMSVEEAMRLSGQRFDGAQVTDPPAEPAPDVNADPNAAPAQTEGQPAPAPDPNAPPKPDAPKPGAIELDQDDPPITVGGIAKPTSKWLEEMEAEYNADTSSLPAEARKKMLEGYINTKHKDVWQGQNTRKAQEAGEQRKAAEAARRDADMKLALAERAKMEAKITLDRLNAEKARIVKLAQTDIDPNSIRDESGQIDPIKQRQLYQVLDARDRMGTIDEEMRTVQGQLQKAEIDRTVSELESFQAAHPEFQTTEPLLAVIQKVEGQRQTSHPDYQKLLDVYDILDYARSRNTTLDLAAERLVAQGKLSVKGATAPAPAAAPATSLPSRTAAQEAVVAGIRAKQAGARPALDGANAAPARPAVAPKQSLGDKIREASTRATSGQGNDALQKMGY